MQEGSALRATSSIVLRGVATRRVAREGRYAAYKWTYMDGYASARRRENQPSEWGYIKRYNRRLFKRMCPYESEFAPALYARTRTHGTLNTPRAKKTKHWIFILPCSDTPSLSLPPHSLSAEPILLSLFLFPAVPFPSPRPNAAYNSRSQFSISADFSIRLRGAAILTRRTRQLLRGRFLLHSLAPSFLYTNTRMSHRRDDIANWKALGFLSPPPRASLTSGQPNRVDATPRL